MTEGSSQGLVVVSEAIRRTIAKEVGDDKGFGNVVAVEETDGRSRRDRRVGGEVDGPREWRPVSCYHEDMVVLMQSECRWLLGPSAVLTLLRSILGAALGSHAPSKFHATQVLLGVGTGYLCQPGQ